MVDIGKAFGTSKFYNGFKTDSEASLRANRSWCPNDETSLLFSENLAEGARFELAVHGVDAGFQDRWFQPLTHPSDNKINYLWRPTLTCLSILLSIWQVPQALATSAVCRSRYRLHICTELCPAAFIATSTGILVCISATQPQTPCVLARFHY